MSKVKHAITLIFLAFALGATLSLIASSNGTTVQWSLYKGEIIGKSFTNDFGLVKMKIPDGISATGTVEYQTFEYSDDKCKSSTNNAKFCETCKTAGEGIISALVIALIFESALCVAVIARLKWSNSQRLRVSIITAHFIVLVLLGASVAGWINDCQGKIQDGSTGIHSGPAIQLLAGVLIAVNIGMMLQVSIMPQGGEHAPLG